MLCTFIPKFYATVNSILCFRQQTDVTPFVGPGLMRVGGCGHAAAPC